ncbi:MAG: hypothetical protein K0S08_233 [Gammaproteobacteria bacterium]|jgi:hypothetical protein|nr:hypothetical protein [Gammaproteobacteria bacterium]
MVAVISSALTNVANAIALPPPPAQMFVFNNTSDAFLIGGGLGWIAWAGGKICQRLGLVMALKPSRSIFRN